MGIWRAKVCRQPVLPHTASHRCVARTLWTRRLICQIWSEMEEDPIDGYYYRAFVRAYLKYWSELNHYKPALDNQLVRLRKTNNMGKVYQTAFDFIVTLIPLARRQKRFRVFICAFRLLGQIFCTRSESERLRLRHEANTLLKSSLWLLERACAAHGTFCVCGDTG